MTPAQYAHRLVEKMTEISAKMSDYSRIDIPTAKLHAKIAVDEILNLVCCMDGKEHWQEYYEQAKQEIEKL
jgi:hypothetical protein